VTTVIARLTGNDSMHELVHEDDGRSVMHTFVRDRDMDRELTPEEAGEWCDTVQRCGGTVNRRITSWPVKAKAEAAPAEYPEGVSA